MRLYFNSAELFLCRKLFSLLIDAYIAHCGHCVPLASTEEKTYFRPDEIYCAIAILNRMEKCASLQRGDQTYLRFILTVDKKGKPRGYRYSKEDISALIAEELKIYNVRSTEQEGE